MELAMKKAKEVGVAWVTCTGEYGGGHCMWGEEGDIYS